MAIQKELVELVQGYGAWYAAEKKSPIPGGDVRVLKLAATMINNREETGLLWQCFLGAYCQELDDQEGSR